MPALTDSQIRYEILTVKNSSKAKSLPDGDGRGTGRLRLELRPMPARVLAEWYAVQYIAGKRSQIKLGAYPALTLKAARDAFKRDFANAIQSRQPIRAHAARRAGTLQDMIDGYTASLETDSTREYVKRLLGRFAAHAGGDRPARTISAGDVTAYLATIYQRGKLSAADVNRSYIRAAFSWGIKSEKDYRGDMAQRFGLELNPAADIPTAEKKVGERWLSPDEFRKALRWVDSCGLHYAKAWMLCAILGQRSSEVLQLGPANWNAAEKTLFWRKTKNGRPHCIPVPDLAAVIIGTLKANEHGLWFPSTTDPRSQARPNVLNDICTDQYEAMGVARFTTRDLRRTWKTLAGKAGVSKEDRDRLQNHIEQGVSAKHYDRYDGMPEKVAAMQRWNVWLVQLLEVK